MDHHFKKNEQELDSQFLDHEMRLANLTRNIPGGAHQCKNDPYFTLLSMSDSFLSMVGYSLEEIKILFNNRFINMIHPEDRAEVLRKTQEQIQLNPHLDLEYRVLCKNGPPIWILDKGRLGEDVSGAECFYCLLIEITDRKREQEELRLSLERHQVIMNQTTDIIFEWDLQTDTLIFSANWRKKFGYDPINSHISSEIPLSKNIHPEDIPAFVNIMEAMRKGVTYSETEFRIQTRARKYLWCRIRATAQFGSDDQVLKAVGVIIDIDAEKKQKEALLDRAQRDTLTGLYNKLAVRELVEERIATQKENLGQALMIIDVDRFKLVNDTYGHLCGDSLLSDVAATLRSHFRSEDIIGRIGGDEFLVYLSGLSEKKDAESKALTVLTALEALRPDAAAPPITCSIGIAFFPYQSADYYALYKCADLALYQVKNSGRNSFAFYDPALCGGKMPCGLVESAIGDIDYHEKGGGDTVGEQLMQYTFRMLYESIDVKTAVERLLEIVGRSYDVSRVYIFESSEDGLRCSNTFEWCNTGVPSEMNNLQNLSYQDDLGDYLRNFDENGIFYCRDIKKLHPDLYKVLAPQGIRSLLQCGIMDDGKFRGYVGFDECKDSRYWTQEQVESLTMISNILSTFLLKLRLKERLAQLEHEKGAAH